MDMKGEDLNIMENWPINLLFLIKCNKNHVVLLKKRVFFRYLLVSSVSLKTHLLHTNTPSLYPTKLLINFCYLDKK